MINKYRKRPVEVEAIQFDGWNWREVYPYRYIGRCYES